VRILYLNTLILVGFWLAVMFSFSAADPSMSSSVVQRFPEVLDASTALEFTRIVHLNQTPLVRSAAPLVTASTWFDLFLHGLVSALTLNLILYALVVARRQLRGRQAPNPRRDRLQFDARMKLFVDGERRSIG